MVESFFSTLKNELAHVPHARRLRTACVCLVLLRAEKV